MPSTVLGVKVNMTTTKKGPCPCGTYILVNKQINEKEKKRQYRLLKKYQEENKQDFITENSQVWTDLTVMKESLSEK